MFQCGDGIAAVGGEECDGGEGCLSCKAAPGYHCETFADGTFECMTDQDYQLQQAIEAEEEIQGISNPDAVTSNVASDPAPTAEEAPQTTAAPAGPNTCGNYIENEGEECDDGNLLDGDGCSSSCIVECGYVCIEQFCLPFCGDGIKAGNEHCDSVEGCSTNCTPLPNYKCEEVENKCTPYCGNGIVDPGEQCDGGHNLIDSFPRPWCTEDCTWAPHWRCFGDERPCVKDCPNEALLAKLRSQQWY